MVAFTNLFFTISSLASLAFSVPLKLRDVVDPPITSPTTGTVWHVGELQTVTWSTTGLPVNMSNPVGMLVLGYMYNNSENLMLNAPLATNINYAAGQVQITVPNVDTRDDYIVVLFGDSGNASPEFTIINDSSSSSSASASVSSTSTSPQSSTPTTGSTYPTTQAPVQSPMSTPGTTSTPSTAGTIPSTLGSNSNQATSVVTSTASSTQSTLTGTAWRNHASGVSILLALISIICIL